ncbi:MAG: hypothetical protein JO202_04095 [Ktedonobacteraceae bacterium]|nr:hypothetical protein [Ktedonobacteraceae bacterium]
MSTNPDRCSQLRKLHAQLTSELQLLRESAQAAEREGVAAIETLTTIKSLQGSLQRITAELQHCPAEEGANAAAGEAKPSPSAQEASAQIRRSWFPDSEQDDDDDEILVDEV